MTIPFGRARLADFDLKPGYVNLNAGSFGVCPKVVREAYNKHSLSIEACPDQFLRIDYAEALKTVRQRLATVVNANDDELAFVTNATAGVNTILRSLASIKVADKMGMAYFSTIYGACGNTVEYLVDHVAHVYSAEIAISYPISDDALLAKTEELFKKDADIKLLVFDLVSSLPGVAMPWERLVALCRKYKVFSVVDAAHGIGHLPIDLAKVDPDFLVTNCHKWYYGYRSTALLYVPRRHHDLMHAMPTGHGYYSDKKKNAGHGKQIGIASSVGANAFVAEFEYPGTVDMAGFLALEASFQYRRSLGGEERIQQYCTQLVGKGAAKVAAMLGTEVLETTSSCAMAQVRLPIDYKQDAHRMPPNERSMSLLKLGMEKHNCSFSPFVHNGTWYARLSAQIFNEMEDFEYVGKVLLKLCQACQ